MAVEGPRPGCTLEPEFPQQRDSDAVQIACGSNRRLAAALTLSADAAEISGAGATFPDPIYAKWAEAYKKETGNGLNYQSIGSAGGIKQIVAKTVTFGASDKPLDQNELDENGLIQFPMIMGGIVPVINVEGIKPGDIVLDGPTLAKIFLGEITQWDDPAIEELNEKIELPARDRRRAPLRWIGHHLQLHQLPRQGEPGVEVEDGFEAAIEWPVGIGAKRNDGVAKSVARTKGAIGYVEYADAKQNKLTYANMINKEGRRSPPRCRRFRGCRQSRLEVGAGLRAGADRSAWRKVLADHGGELHSDADRRQDAAASARRSNFSTGRIARATLAEALDYVPMPDNVVGLVQEEWAKIKDPAGKPLFTAMN